jgi:hypothetical protein
LPGLLQVFVSSVGEMHFLFAKHLMDQILVWSLVHHMMIKYGYF